MAMVETQEGPTTVRFCYPCRHYVQERFQVQGDVGYDKYCCHPINGERKHMGSYGEARTPDWCPVLSPIAPGA